MGRGICGLNSTLQIIVRCFVSFMHYTCRYELYILLSSHMEIIGK